MTISKDEFKNTMRHFSSGVTIVTIRAGDDIHGLTASAVTSVSADPPLISVIINREGRAHPLLQRDDAVFAVNILSQAQQALSDRFAWIEEDRFAEGQWSTAETGAPVLDDALAWLDCTIYSRHTAGTHVIYLGEVQASRVIQPEQKPLIYWNRNYHSLIHQSDESTR
jgi:flavin reductase (DIM6/NTAB) family NADH-FMN oxidoreductase RutF